MSLQNILTGINYLIVNSKSNINSNMRPITIIRTKRFQQTQAAFARLAGVTQGTVSKWEAGTLAPSQSEMTRIRTAGIKLGMAWNDEWFFVVPRENSATEATP